MKKSLLKKVFAVGIAVAVFFAPTFLLAQDQTGNRPPTQQTGNTAPTQQTGNTAPTQQTGNQPPTKNNFDLDVKFKNPLKVSSIIEAIALLMNIILKIAVPFVIVMFIWSGLKFILAQGNKEELIKARKIFFGTVIGTLIILGAWTITNAIVGTVDSLMNSTSK